MMSVKFGIDEHMVYTNSEAKAKMIEEALRVRGWSNVSIDEFSGPDSWMGGKSGYVACVASGEPFYMTLSSHVADHVNDALQKGTPPTPRLNIEGVLSPE